MIDSVYHIEDKICSETEKQKHDQFNKTIPDFMGDFDRELILEEPTDKFKEPESSETDPSPEKEETREPEKEINDSVMGPDPIINTTFYLPKGDKAELGKVVNQKWNTNGLLTGRKHRNPMLDSVCLYC